MAARRAEPAVLSSLLRSIEFGAVVHNVVAFEKTKELPGHDRTE
jgi:hypothetical protein